MQNRKNFPLSQRFLLNFNNGQTRYNVNHKIRIVNLSFNSEVHILCSIANNFCLKDLHYIDGKIQLVSWNII